MSAPSTETATLPNVPSLRSPSVFGATAIFTALAIGSGEMLFWPGLVPQYGAGVLWIAVIAVLFQWVINIEVARYSMATGEPIVVGAARHAPIVALILLGGAILPWIWPGWVRSAGQLGAGLTGLPEHHLSAFLLLFCALLLLGPRRVYPVVEKVQALFLAIILLGILYLFVQLAVMRPGLGSFVSQLGDLDQAAAAGREILSGTGAAYFGLLGGIVFAGAGGILNLGYGMLVCEKGFGMGGRAPKVAGLAHSAGLAPSSEPVSLEESETNRTLWQRWMRLVRLEHAGLFVGGNLFATIFISAIFALLWQNSREGDGVNFLVNSHALFGSSVNGTSATIFAVVGFLVFLTSAIGILDVTSRIAAAITKALLGNRGPGVVRLFHYFVIGETVLGTILIYADPRQPFWLLATSAVLNIGVMAIYAGLILWLNRTVLPRFVRPSLATSAVVALAGLSFAAIFVITMTKIF